MSGQGHQFPGNFGNNPTGMRTGFGSPCLGNQMPTQMPGILPGSINNPSQMVGMTNQMVPSYGANVQGQIGMQSQQIPVANPSPSPGLVSPMSSAISSSALQSPGMPGASGNVTRPSSAGPGSVGPGPGSVGPGGSVAQPSDVTSQSQPPQNKEFNTASLCKFGQETVQDLFSRTQDVFQTLKTIQPPNGTSQGSNSSNDKKAKMQEQLRTIRLLFRRIRLIYEKCNESCQLPGMEYTHIESLIPLKDEQDNKSIEDTKNSEAYKLVLEENRELVEQVVLKNKQLKEVINNLRTIIWEINVMLNMRRS